MLSTVSLFKAYYRDADGKNIGTVKLWAPSLDKAFEIALRSCKNGETVHRVKAI